MTLLYELEKAYRKVEKAYRKGLFTFLLIISTLISIIFFILELNDFFGLLGSIQSVILVLYWVTRLTFTLPHSIEMMQRLFTFLLIISTLISTIFFIFELNKFLLLFVYIQLVILLLYCVIRLKISLLQDIEMMQQRRMTDMSPV